MAIKLTLVMLYVIFLIIYLRFYRQSNTSVIHNMVYVVLDSTTFLVPLLAFWFTRLCHKLRGLKELSNVY